MSDWEVTVEELKGKMERGERFVLIDVREPSEFDICRIPGAKLIPLQQLPTRVTELNPADDIVVQCHTGNRSMTAVIYLRQVGFKGAKNLAGGIDAWSERVDPSVPRY